MSEDHSDWENLYLDSGGGSGVMISSVVNPALKQYEGKTVAEMAKAENKPEMDAFFDFILADKGQTEALYFMANENDLQYGLKQPWTSIGLDAGETSLDGPLFEPHTHPRAWGAMPRFLGHYARDLQLLDLAAGDSQDHLFAGAARTSRRPRIAEKRLLRRRDHLRSCGHHRHRNLC